MDFTQLTSEQAKGARPPPPRALRRAKGRPHRQRAAVVANAEARHELTFRAVRAGSSRATFLQRSRRRVVRC